MSTVAVPSRAGRLLDREAARTTIVQALAGFQRGRVALPVRLDLPTVRTVDLRFRDQVVFQRGGAR